MKRIFLVFIFCWLSLFSLLSQGVSAGAGTDNIVRLISADKAQLLEVDGKPFRKVEGSPARFFHNNTYLLCDTAFWNVEDEFIDARGNVQIIQGNTILTGESLHYIAKENTAEFRGSLVQLIDKDKNLLRTNHLDYNTRDSIAFFYFGASMKDSEGSIIESDRGVFESENSRFTFIEDVQMFSDSLFFISDSLVFLSDISTAFYGNRTKAWRGDNYISSNGGWYDQQNEKIFFENDVYVQTIDYEVWSEALFYDRISINSKLEKDIQILDTINNSLVLGDQLIYEDSSKYTEITKHPVLVGLAEENGVIDSLFMTADTILYYTVRMCDIDSSTIALSKQRKELAELDVFESARANMKKDVAPPVGNPSDRMKGIPSPLADTTRTPMDSLGSLGSLGTLDSLVRSSLVDTTHAPMDSLGSLGSLGTLDSLVRSSLVDTTHAPMDSLQVRAVDSLAILDSIPKVTPLDTTEIIFIEAYHGVKMFKSDFQLLCDSLIYTGLDSIARLYEDPVLWNEITNQLTADSMQLVMKDGELRKGFLLSNAFVIAEDTPTYYNQIKAPEMVGYFSEGTLSRFDGMGGVQAIFYLEQDSVVNTILLKETKVMSARLKHGGLEKVYNLEDLKNDAYSVGDLPLEDQRLRGFNLRAAERPANRDSITTRKIRKSIRQRILNTPMFPLFNSTSEYFPNYMDQILLEINLRKPIKWKKFDPNYVEEVPVVPVVRVVGVLTEEVDDTTKIELVKDEVDSLTMGESLGDEKQVDKEDLTTDSIESGTLSPEKELSKKQKRAELKEKKRLERKERKLERRKMVIERRLKREEVRELRRQERTKKREERRLKNKK